MERRLAVIRAEGKISLGGRIVIALTESDIALHPFRRLDHHPNAMTLTATSVHGEEVRRETYYSVGGGFVVTEAESKKSGDRSNRATTVAFRSAAELLTLTAHDRISVSQAMMRHECVSRTETEVRERLLHIRDVMVACENKGMSRDGYLPGNLRVRRRAQGLVRAAQCRRPAS